MKVETNQTHGAFATCFLSFFFFALVPAALPKLRKLCADMPDCTSRRPLPVSFLGLVTRLHGGDMIYGGINLNCLDFRQSRLSVR